MDKYTKTQILAEVREAIRMTMEGVNEQWISGEELGKQFQMFTPSWLKRYGQTLPRTQAVVECNGERHRSAWYYPRHRIARLINEGKLRDLSLSESAV